MSRDERSEKQSIYFTPEMLEEVRAEAARLDRSMAWIVQRAWKVARVKVGQIKSDSEVG